MGVPDFELASYYPIFAYFVLLILFAIGTLIATHVIGPNRNTPVNQMPYESGMDPIGDARQRFDVKFYLVAIMFLVFDVELLFLYPWAVVAYRRPSSETAPASEILIPEALRGPVFWCVLTFIVLLWRPKGLFGQVGRA